ncbi:hypothetical protein BU16DRAFT_82936 [Lophium mytilinum]|uniref:Uncharacterized protein n=1 Tax=Lophium mytilinum TaxID=390894 RepID=A0A6A6QRP2_9PEZI|nr:hypothetical protein BU16DRAFT_82936 [Lophium mytilinum]
MSFTQYPPRGHSFLPVPASTKSNTRPGDKSKADRSGALTSRNHQNSLPVSHVTSKACRQCVQRRHSDGSVVTFKCDDCIPAALNPSGSPVSSSESREARTASDIWRMKDDDEERIVSLGALNKLFFAGKDLVRSRELLKDDEREWSKAEDYSKKMVGEPPSKRDEEGITTDAHALRFASNQRLRGLIPDMNEDLGDKILDLMMASGDAASISSHKVSCKRGIISIVALLGTKLSILLDVINIIGSNKLRHDVELDIELSFIPNLDSAKRQANALTAGTKSLAQIFQAKFTWDLRPWDLRTWDLTPGTWGLRPGPRAILLLLNPEVQNPLTRFLKLSRYEKPEAAPERRRNCRTTRLPFERHPRETKTAIYNTICDQRSELLSVSDSNISDDNYMLWGKAKGAIWKQSQGRSKEWRCCKLSKASNKGQYMTKNGPLLKKEMVTVPINAAPITFQRRDKGFRPVSWVLRRVKSDVHRRCDAKTLVDDADVHEQWEYRAA